MRYLGERSTAPPPRTSISPDISQGGCYQVLTPLAVAELTPFPVLPLQGLGAEYGGRVATPRRGNRGAPAFARGSPSPGK